MTIATKLGNQDVLIIGGGAIGLAIGLELRQRGAAVTLLSRNFAEAASHAAAGMLAPQAEQLPAGPMRDLCLQSRDRYPEWIHKLETLTGLETGYWNCGILAPLYAEPNAEQKLAAATQPQSVWLDRAAIHQHQPGLSAEVGGGWWYPQDAQVDNRALTRALWAAVQEVGVAVRDGVTVQEIVRDDRRVTSVRSTAGDWQAEHYILATGAWSPALLPIAVFPKKGQMLAVRVPENRFDPENLPLQTVLFGDEIYIVPRRNGRIVIGATSESVGFAPHNTPAGIQTLLSGAIRLFPALQEFPIEEFWWGFRPATPDELPILGSSPAENLTLATGHYRNGILLIPATARLIADRVLNQQADPLLPHFHWSRFIA